MITRRIAIISASAIALVAGGAAAVAATVKDDRKATETAILADAAKRLDVSPSELKDALGKAQDAQLDQAVKDGKLTQAQADAMKKHRAQEGTVLGGPGGMRMHRGGPGGRGGQGGPMGMIADAAKALGMDESKLHEQLRSGKTLTAIAKAQDKDLKDVKAAVKAALTKRLDTAVKDKKLTDAQRDHVLGEFDEHFDAFASGQRPGPGGPGPGGHGHGGPGHGGPGGPPPGFGPGAGSEQGTQNGGGAQDGAFPQSGASESQPA